MDLFEKYHMTEFTEFPFLPEELRGIDLEPDDLPNINIEAGKIFQYVLIRYDTGESKELNEFVGFNFLKKKKVTYRYRDLVERKYVQDEEYINSSPNYILVTFEPEDLENVLRMFNIPSYQVNNAYDFRDLKSKNQIFDVTDFEK